MSIQFGVARPVCGLPRSLFAVSAFILVTALAPLYPAAQPATPPPLASIPAPTVQPVDKARVVEGYGRLPLSFEANQGQADSEARFLSRGQGYSLFLTGSEAVLALSKRKNRDADLIRLKLAGTNSAATIAGQDPLKGTTNYFVGNDPAKWHTAVPTYRRVKYTGVYPGVDLVYYGNQSQLEYDFVLAPGADPKLIRFGVTGARQLRISADGSLVIEGKNGEIAFHKPLIYQERDGKRQPIEGSFALASKDTVRFQLGEYDRSSALVIDPVLSYSTYLGGSGLDAGNSIAVDSHGNAYVTGETASGDFPITSGSFQSKDNSAPWPGPHYGNSFDYGTCFVTKLNATGTGILYSTFLGGSGYDDGTGIAVDSSGAAYVVGMTTSKDFPTTAGAFQTVNRNLTFTAFVTKLNPTGTALEYSTLIGGSGEAPVWGEWGGDGAWGDQGNAIGIDSQGDAYITGSTNSSDFPVTPGAFQEANHSAQANAFVTRLNATGTALIYSTYLGGSTDNAYYDGNVGFVGDTGLGIAVGGSGTAVVVGSTSSKDFPVTAGAFQTTNLNPGAIPFVTEINNTGTALEFSTYLGGSNNNVGTSGVDAANSVALGSNGYIYVAGSTHSTNFPVIGATFPGQAPVTGLPFQSQASSASYGQGFDGFLSLLNAAGSQLVYSTYVGANPTGFSNPALNRASNHEGTVIYGVAVDADGDAWVGGTTGSDVFPLTAGAIVTSNRSANVYSFCCSYSGFLAEISPTPQNVASAGLLYSTYLDSTPVAWRDDIGGHISSVSIDSNGAVYTTGNTYGTDFPVTPGVFQPTFKAGDYGTGFVTKLGPSVPSAVAPTISPNPLVFGNQNTNTSSSNSITITNPGTQTLTISSITPAASGAFSQTNNCGSLTQNEDCFVDVTFDPKASGAQSATFTVTDTAGSQTFQATGTGVAPAAAQIQISPSSLIFGPQAVGTTSPIQQVTVTNTGNVPVSFACALNPETNLCLDVIGIQTTGDFGTTFGDLSIPVSAKRTYGVYFAPTATGTRTGSFILFGNAGGRVALTGTGVPSPPSTGWSIRDSGVQSPGVLYVDVKVVNTGATAATNATINSLTLKPVTGTGTVKLDASSPALPISLGSLAAGASKTVRLYIDVPATVTRFTITETGTMQAAGGTTYSYSSSELVTP